MMNIKKISVVAVLLLGGIVLLLAANWLAGVLLFLAYRQDPSAAGLWTIQSAWISASDTKTMQKVTGASVIAFLVVLGAPFSLLMATRKKQVNLHGEARFANTQDLEKEKLHAPKGIIAGMHEGRLIRLPGYEFTLLAAPTRTGKGVGFVIPNLLTFEGSAVILDIKGENYQLTSRFRRQHLENEVYYFNPFSEKTHRWNPLSYVSRDAKFMANDLLALAALLYPDNEKDPFWSASARNLFVGIGMLVIESSNIPATFGEMLRQATGKGQEISEYLKSIIETHRNSDNPLSDPCVSALYLFLNNSETVLKGILATFVAPLSPWGNPVVDKATSADDFDLRDVRKRKMSIFMHIPAGEVMQANFIINLFFSQLINENVKTLPEKDPSLKEQCLVLLDEFTAAGKIPIVAKAVGYMAGYNMRLAIVIQDKSQLESVYGKEDSHNIISNMGLTIFFTPSTTEEAESYSKMIGDITVMGISSQRSNVGALNAGRYGLSETESQQKRALMLPQEIRMLDKNKEIISRAGIPIVLADKIKYFEHAFFKERFDSVPQEEVNILGETRMVPIALKLPPENWTMYHSQVERSNFYLSNPGLGLEFADLSTDALLDGINDPETPQVAKTAQLKQLAQLKFEEFMNTFESTPPLTPEDVQRFENGTALEVELGS